MMRTHIKYLLTSAAMMCFLAPFSTAHAETLEQAALSALTYHPSIEAAKAGVGAAHQERRAEFSGYFPELSLSAAAGRIYGDNATSRGLSVTRGAGYSGLGEGSLTVRQMIFDGFETSRRVDAAQAREQLAKTNVLDIRETISLRAVQSYIDVLRARMALSMLTDYHGEVSDYLSRINNMVEEGAADEAELQQARDIQVILESIIADYLGQYKIAETNYLEAAGHLPDADMERPVPRLDMLPDGIEDAVIVARDTHPMVVGAKIKSRAAKYEVEAQRGAYYPDLDGELSYYKSDKEDLIGGEVVDARALMRLNWSFSSGGAEIARVEQKKFASQEALANIADTQLQIEREVRLSYAEFATAKKQLELWERRQKLNEKLFSTYQTQFEGSRITQLQLMQAENQLFNTKLEKMNSEYRQLAAQYGILASMGRLQESLNLASLETNEQN